jgi:hypothetical protein
MTFCFRTKCIWVGHILKMEERDATLLRWSKERYWRTVKVSWILHCSPMKHTSTRMVTLTSNTSDFGPQRIQDLPLPTHDIRIELQYGMRYRASVYSVACSSMVQSLLMFTSVCWVKNLPISWWDMAFQWIQPGLNTTVPDLTPSISYFALFMTFRGDIPVEPIFCSIWGRALMATNPIGLNFSIIFCGGTWKIGCSRKIRTHFRNWKLAYN